MTRRIAKAGMVFVLAWVCLGAGDRAATGSAVGIGDAFKGSFYRSNVNHQFKLKGGGQIDIHNSTITFAGQATHLGQFTAFGHVDQSTGAMTATLALVGGDTIEWRCFYAPELAGDVDGFSYLDRGTGRFADAHGVAHGVITLDEDFMFTMDFDGFISFVPTPCLTEPCF